MSENQQTPPQVSPLRARIGCGVFAALMGLAFYAIVFAPEPVNARRVCERALRAQSTETVRLIPDGFTEEPGGGRMGVISSAGGAQSRYMVQCKVSGTNAKNAGATLTVIR